MSSDVTPRLSAAPDYGRYKRIVEPDRHVYRSTMTFLRLVIATVCLLGCAMTAFCARVILKDDELRAFLPTQILAGMFMAGGLVVFGGLLLILVAHVRLTITPRSITVRDRNFVGRTRERSWRIYDVESIGFATGLTFNVASTSMLYRIRIGFAGGQEAILRFALDDRREAERLALDITHSIAQMAERN
jgi:hypothetical protein